MRKSRSSPQRRDLNEMASGKPGAVQSDLRNGWKREFFEVPMRRSLAPFSELEPSNHTLSSADCITITPDLVFGTHSGNRSTLLTPSGASSRPSRMAGAAWL